MGTVSPNCPVAGSVTSAELTMSALRCSPAADMTRPPPGTRTTPGSNGKASVTVGYERRHGDNVHTRPWPVADVRLLTERKMTMVVQVSGKLKDRIEVERDISEKAATEMALASPRVQEALGGALPARVIAKPPRLVNIIQIGRAH